MQYWTFAEVACKIDDCLCLFRYKNGAMYCRYCGKEIEDDSLFCKHCGKAQPEANDKSPIDEYLEAPKEKETVDSVGRPTLKVIVEKLQTNTEDKTRRVVKVVLKELLMLLIFTVVAFLGGIATYGIVQLTPIPEVTEEQQAAYNERVYKLEQEYDGNPMPIGRDLLALVKFDEFRYDDEILYSSLHDLDDINRYRQNVLDDHSGKDSKIAFWIILIALPVARYIYLFVVWFKKGNKVELKQE